MDYMVSNAEGEEITAISFNEARRIATSYRRMGFDPIIDQYDANQELTGTYWDYKDGKLTKH